MPFVLLYVTDLLGGRLLGSSSSTVRSKLRTESWAGPAGHAEAGRDFSSLSLSPQTQRVRQGLRSRRGERGDGDGLAEPAVSPGEGAQWPEAAPGTRYGSMWARDGAGAASTQQPRARWEKGGWQRHELTGGTTDNSAEGAAAAGPGHPRCAPQVSKRGVERPPGITQTQSQRVGHLGGCCGKIKPANTQQQTLNTGFPARLEASATAGAVLMRFSGQRRRAGPSRPCWEQHLSITAAAAAHGLSLRKTEGDAGTERAHAS